MSTWRGINPELTEKFEEMPVSTRNNFRDLTIAGFAMSALGISIWNIFNHRDSVGKNLEVRDGKIVLKDSITDLTLVDSDAVTVANNLTITSGTGGIIHTGMGTVTQTSTWANGVELNTTSGIISLAASQILLAQTTVQFTLTNSTIKATSLILVSTESYPQTSSDALN